MLRNGATTRIVVGFVLSIELEVVVRLLTIAQLLVDEVEVEVGGNVLGIQVEHPRELVTGLVGDRHRTEVVSGLAEGEEVVVSGQFLLDSESQLQEAIRKMLDRRAGRDDSSAISHRETLLSCPMHPDVISAEPGRCSRCGMDLEERAGSRAELAELYEEHAHRGEQDHEHGGPSSEAPSAGEYTCPMHPEIVSGEPGRCPVCGMFLQKAAAEDEEQP